VINHLGFVARYECRILEDLPREGSDVLRFNSSGRFDKDLELSTRLVVECIPNKGAPWVGLFEGVAKDYPLTGLYATPCEERVCVVNRGASYIVRTTAPQSWERPPILPVLAIFRVPEHPIMLFSGFQDVAAYGPHGLMWCVDHVGADDVKISAVNSHSIIGTAWDPQADRMVPFSIAPTTGHVNGGWVGATTRSGLQLSFPAWVPQY
jgi:hypothetical protein